MLAPMLLLGILAASPLAPSAPSPDPGPAPQDTESYSVLEGDFTLRFLEKDLTPQDAKVVLSNFVSVRNLFIQVLQLDPGRPEITIRVREAGPRYYYMNGMDKIVVDYPGIGYLRPVVPGDNRVLEFGMRVFAQHFLHKSLTSTAGLDPRLVPSITEYLTWALQMSTDPAAAVIPEGPGQVWVKFDQVYGMGWSTFLLNMLVGEKLPAHRVVPFLRDMAVQLAEDPHAGGFFDLLGPPLPLFQEEDQEPGEPLVAGNAFRPSRVTLFNGVRIMDVDREPMDPAERLRDFDLIHTYVVRYYPSRGLTGDPPRLNGHDIWELYSEFRPRVQLARDDVDFHLVMREYFGRLGDPFMAVISNHGAPLWRGVRGVSVTTIGDAILVESVAADSDAAQKGLTAGDQILTAHGKPAADVLQTLEYYFRLCGSCSSETEIRARALNVFLTGADDSEIEITVAGEPEPRTLLLTTASPSQDNQAQLPALVEHEMREDGIGVIRLRAFLPDSWQAYVRAMAELQQKKPKGIIIDVRDTVLGEPQFAVACVNLLLDRSVTLGVTAIRDPSQRRGNLTTGPITLQPIPNMPSYTGKAAILIDPWTTASAEVFALGFKLAGRGPVVGQNTAGTFTQRMMPPQPWHTLAESGMLISMTQRILMDRNGEPLLGSPVTPTHLVMAERERLGTDVDPILAKAVALILE